jgi:CBS domain-containing protein
MRTVQEVMTMRPVSVLPRDTMGDVVDVFERHDFNAVPVADEKGVLRGIVTKLDLVRALRPTPDVELHSLYSMAQTPVETIMNRGVIALRGGDSLAHAADLMIETRLRSLPVVEPGRNSERMLVGIISQGDLLRALQAAFAQ